MKHQDIPYRVQTVGLTSPEIAQLRKAIEQRLKVLRRITDTLENDFVGLDQDRDAFLDRLKYGSIAEVHEAIKHTENILKLLAESKERCR
jgi:hypothetical protein